MEWDSSENWYASLVGEKGHYYHQSIVLPNALRLLACKHSLLDMGCGSGVLARHLPEGIEYVGIDSSIELIQTAKKTTPNKIFLVADAATALPVEKKDFACACFILSLQNMAHGMQAVENAASHVKPGGKILLVLNHPCFRIPRQSGWEVDEQMKLQYRRMNVYMTPQKIPILTAPSKKENSPQTTSFHHSLSDYATWLKGAKCVITEIEEWCSDKTSTGAKAKMENRARKEFPLFLAILARKS